MSAPVGYGGLWIYNVITRASPGGTVVRNLPANAGHVGLIPGSGRSPGVGNSNSLQDSCLKNSMYRQACQATVHGTAKRRTRLSTHTHNYLFL